MRSILTVVAVALLGLGFAASARADLPKFKGFSAWSAPVNLGPPVNTTYDESAAAFSADGLSLYFNRNFNGLNPAQPGKVDEDIYVAQRTSRQSPWGDPVALDAINTTPPMSEMPPSRATGACCSSRATGSPASADSISTSRIGSRSCRALRAGGRRRSTSARRSTAPLDDVGPAIFQNPDGTGVLYFTSNRPGRGGFDIYASPMGADGSFGRRCWLKH